MALRSIVSPEFRKCLAKLPAEVQEQARKAYNTWRNDPYRSGLRFKRLKPHELYSVRIGDGYRALAYRPEPDVYVWDWIGSHADYDRIVDSL